MIPEYSESQLKQDLATLDIDEGSSLTSNLLTSKFRKLAKIRHPDRKDGSKEAFQKLNNAYDRLTDMIDDGCVESDDNYESEFFKKTATGPKNLGNETFWRRASGSDLFCSGRLPTFMSRFE